MANHQKALENTNLKKSLGLLKNEKMPLLTIELRYFNHDFGHELKELLEGFERLKMQIIVAPSFHDSLKQYLGNLKVCPDNLADQLIKTSTMTLFLSDDEHIGKEIKRTLANGCVPICYNFSQFKGVLKDYDPVREEGNSFLFKDFNKWDVFAAVVRALENHKFSWDWQTLSREAYQASTELVI